MNFKIIFLAVVLSVLLVDAVPNQRRRSASHGRRQKHQKKCHEVTTTTPIPTTTTLAPNTSVCNYIVNINSTSGAYLKTICHIQSGLNTAQAADFCTANHMTLMRMTDDNTIKGFKDFISQVYRIGNRATFILNGYSNTTGNWVLYSNPSTPLYSGLVWDTNSVSNIPFPQCSLYTQFRDGTYQAVAYKCTHTSYFSCEFI